MKDMDLAPMLAFLSYLPEASPSVRAMAEGETDMIKEIEARIRALEAFRFGGIVIAEKMWTDDEIRKARKEAKAANLQPVATEDKPGPKRPIPDVTTTPDAPELGPDAVEVLKLFRDAFRGIVVTAARIAEILKKDRKKVDKAIRVLKEGGFLQDNGKAGIGRAYLYVKG